ncbi:MAG: YbjN domain-containing protein [Armatimonadetes bacterium]|nr:YbjN domain-containing protein [Armatimonadota bacterium]
MFFITPAQEECYHRVKPWIIELFGDRATARESEPVFEISEGSARAEVGIFPWKQHESVICTRALVVHQVEFHSDLLQYLLRQNSVIRFGAFGIESDNEIYFIHSIVGSTCDKPELEATIRSVSSMADHYDDEIRNRWGGLRAVDAAET